MLPSFSQSGEDTWIRENLALPKQGFFVDIGASDGRTNNNTLAFENLGWPGFLIEPDPRYTELGKNGRWAYVLRYAVASVPGDVEFHQQENRELSGIAREGGTVITVKARRLDEILRSHGIKCVELLSIDTEGTELDVWASLGDYLRPNIVIIEWHTEGRPDNPDAIKEVFQRDGYDLRKTIGCNLIFTKK